MEPKHFETLYPADSFSEEITQIFTYIRHGDSCQLIGLPGVGRGNLLSCLAYNRSVREHHAGEQQKWGHFVYVDFSELARRSLFDVTKVLFLALADSLRDRKKLEEHDRLHDIFKQHLDFNDEIVLFQGLKEAMDYLTLEKKLIITFLFDRFEEYVPHVTSDFFTNLTILRNRAKYRFSLVVSMNRPLEDALEPALLSDFYEYIVGHQVYLRLFDEACGHFRIKYLEKVTGEALGEAVMKQILSLTGGHGRLTGRCCEAYLADKPDKKDLEAFFLTHTSIQRMLLKIWKSLSPREQKYVADMQTDDPAAREYVEKIGLVRSGKIQIPLLERFLTSQKDTLLATGEQIEYDLNTNEIKKGEIIISEQLTAAEFRLLAYLLEHAEQIIDREQIIETVWKESKSTAGVTDQAVDQLVFRLRKKIEADPNHPTHLQTVKGRGFKFSA